MRCLLLKRKRAHSPDGMTCKQARTHDRWDSCVVQLTGSPLRQAHHIDAIQLTGCPICWNAAFADNGSFSPCTLAEGVFFGASHVCPLSLLHGTLPSQSLTGGLVGRGGMGGRGGWAGRGGRAGRGGAGSSEPWQITPLHNVYKCVQ